MAGGFEQLHDPLSSPCWLMRILCPIVEFFVLTVLKFNAHVLAGRAIGSELVRDQNSRETGLFADKLAQESLVSAPVKTALHQRVEHEAVLIDGAPEPVFPEPVFLAVDRDDNLVEIPFFSELRARRRNLSAKSRPNFSARRRTVSWLTIIPCAASKSSTILRPDAPSRRLKSSEPRSQSPPKRKIWTAAGRTACSVLHSSGECVRACSIVIATGARYRRLAVSDLQRYEGRDFGIGLHRSKPSSA